MVFKANETNGYISVFICTALQSSGPGSSKNAGVKFLIHFFIIFDAIAEEQDRPIMILWFTH